MHNKSISTSDLIYLNEAAKALKKKRFIIYGNKIVACDNLSYLCYVTLDSNMFNHNTSLYGLVIESRELSAFIKTITTESDFTLNSVNNGYIINTITGQLLLSYSNIDVSSLFKAKTEILCEEECINDKIPEIFSIHRNDGSFHYIHHNKFFMTVFYGILPINKSDKIYLTIRKGYNSMSFIADFIVRKKKFDVNITIAYLDI